MALNLVRNSRVYFTTNTAAATGAVLATGLSASNTFELQVQDGFSFSQTTNQDTVSINEAGATPNRGSRSFNTSLAPVEFSFTTYVRPYKPSTTVTAEEQTLWNALLGVSPIATPVSIGTTPVFTRTAGSATATITGTALAAALTPGKVITIGGIVGDKASEWNAPATVVSYTSTVIVIKYFTAPSGATTGPAGAGTPTYQLGAWSTHPAVAADTLRPAAYSLVTASTSGVNQLQVFGLVIIIDGGMYLLDNCALNQAQIDFSLDGIASIQWSGNGTAIRVLDAPTDTAGTWSGTLTGTYQAKQTAANYITNKLSTVSIVSNIGGIAGTTYALALTGGSITIANNIGYITPANLGVVNVPIGYYTGNLAINGSITAYLHSGSSPANNTGTLLANILSNVSTAAETKYKIELNIGGNVAASTHVELSIPGASISVPTVETQQIVSTTINFNAQGTNADLTLNTYDITNSNPIQVRYYSA